MAYIGNTPAEAYTSFDKQTITGNGGASYTLDHAVANEQEIEVFVNNVRQEPSVAYTVSGTALTMTGNVESSDDFYVVFQGKAVQTTSHPEGQDLKARDGTFSGDVDTNSLVSSSNIDFKTNGHSTNTHSFLYNEDGGEMHLRNSTGGGGGFFDYGGTFGTRVLNNATTGDMQIGHGAVNTAGNIKFMGAGYTERMRINSSGNVGIGTSSPSSDAIVKFLHIADSTSAGIVLDGAEKYSIYSSSSSQLVFRNEDDDTSPFLIGNTGNMTNKVNITFATREVNFDGLNNNPSGQPYQILLRNYRSANTGSHFLLGYSGNNLGNTVADLEFNMRGDGQAYADSGWAGTGADYAEYFEWNDGNTNDEDRRGYSVVLVNNKIRKATSSDVTSDIIGVISANPVVTGDAGWNKWSGKHVKDDFGSYVWETFTITEWEEADGTKHSYPTDQIPSDVTAPSDATVLTVDDGGNTLKRRQLNSSYDDSQTYTPREDRQEWDAVGLMGKLRLRAGQPTGDRWIKMRDIATDDDGNVTVEEWLIR